MTWNQIDPAQTPWDGDTTTWMKQLPNNIPLQDLSIPGTHDSAAKDMTCTAISATQSLKIEEQLQNGIRFLDLRVKIMYRDRGLAMYHADDKIDDPDKPGSLDQYYYKVLINKCVQFLKEHPKEVIIASVKCEGDDSYGGWTIEDWFRQIANEVAADNPPGTWDKWWDYRSDVFATLGDVRGKLVLWRRYPRGGKFPGTNYSGPFGLDLTPLNIKYENTTGADWVTDNNGYVFVQDMYSGDFLPKFDAWGIGYSRAFYSRWNPNHPDKIRQFINFSSLGGGYPSDNARVLNAALHDWLSAVHSNQDKNGNNLGGQKVRTGVGVVPMDYPTQDNINLLIRTNFEWSYRIAETPAGAKYYEAIRDRVKNA